MASYTDEDIFKILLATDCHLGYLENDPVRGNDSLTTFEEILKIGVEQGADFVLLGGDLFHDNKPSRKVLHGCLSLLRKYCLGDRPVQFEFLSDPTENFKHSPHPVVNFEDPHLNVSLPVFSIHGNHDDPAGPGCFCTLDLLGLTGLLNYFGKCVDLERVSISPLMLQKGRTRVCLYGLGSVRDERLHRMFLAGQVSMLRPKERADQWFNLMVLHQNRAKHGAKNYIPEQFLDDFLDLVVWGHEHECRIDKEWNEKQSFYVTQPGSSVATSLCHGEAVKKHVGLLQIRGREFQIQKIPLQTVRPFYIRDVDLEESSLNLHSADAQEKVMDYCSELVDQFVERARDELTGHPKQPQQPLVRLRIFYPPTFEPFSVHRFGHSYVSKVANSKDILLFSRKKSERMASAGVDEDLLSGVLRREGFERRRVEDLVKKYFEQTDENKRLLVLSEAGLSSAVQEFVDKEVKEAIGALVEHQMRRTQERLKQSLRGADAIDEELVKFREERKSQTETTEFSVIMKDAHATQKRAASDDDLFEEDAPAAKRGRGRGRGRATARASRAAKRGGRPTRTSSRQTDLSSYLQNADDSDDEPVSRSTKGRKGVVFDFSD